MPPRPSPKPKRGKLEALPETCGSCRFARDVVGDDALQCVGLPPMPVIGPDCEVSWHRGGPVEPHDPACAFYGHKGRA